MKRRVAISLLGLLLPGYEVTRMRAQPPAPGELKLQAVTATSKEVTLAWAGAGGQSRLERKSGRDAWTNMAATTEDKSTDSKIGPFGTYDYRVISGAKTSNVITVGPPPAGFHTIAPRPAQRPDTSFGRFISLVLDSNGDPAVAFVYADPNGDGKFDDTQLMFASWDRATYRWREPVFVATLGNFDPRPPMTCVSVARDAQTGTYGIAWVEPGSKVLHLARSTDGGTNWTEKPVLTDSRELGGPSMTFIGGKLHLAVSQNSRNSILYLTGGLDQEPATSKSTLAPMIAGNNAVLRASSLALDEKGAPALAYWQKANNGNLWTLAYWRPGTDLPLKVTDTGASNYAPDGVLLAFAGVQPRIVLDSRLDRGQISSHYSVVSNDGGATWTKPIPIPDDGNEHLGGYMSFAVSKEGPAAFAGDVAGGNTSGMKCSWPKLARTKDFAEWTTCAPQGTQDANIRTLWGTVLYAPSGLLYMVFQNRQTSPQQGLPAGLLIWGGR